MDEHELRAWLRRVRDGVVSRRQFTRAMIGAGLTAPLVGQMLASVGLAQTAPRPAFTPTRRGGGGQLRTLWWQAATLLNPHFAAGLTNADGSRLFYEPLAAFDPDGNLVPVLAQELPSVQNGDVARDGRSVTWRLKKGVQWHDGKPFTADDVVFNWEYAADPATAAVTAGSYRALQRVEALDPHTVRLTFAKPAPFWAEAFCGNRGMIIPKHVFEPFRGAKSREAPANLKPVGTGPYRYVDFKSGDSIRAELNPGLPRAEPAVLRHGRGEGRRRRRVRRPRRAADRRVRLGLEHAGRGRRPEAARAGRQGPRRDRHLGRRRVHRHEPRRSLARGRRGAGEPEGAASHPHGPRRPRRAGAPGRPGRHPGADLRPPGPGHRELPQRAGPLPVEGHPLGVQRREGQPAPRGRRLEAGRATAFAPRTASA